MSKIIYGYITAALFDLLVGGVIFTFPYATQSIGAGTLGIISNSIFAIVYVIVCALFSRLRFGENRRLVLAWGCFLFAAGCLLLLFFRTKAMFLIAPVFMAAGSATLYPALQTWFTENLDKPTMVRVMGGYSTSST